MKIGCLHLEGNFIKMYLSLSVSQVMYELSRSLHDDQKAAHLMNHLVQVTCCFQWNIRLPGIQCYFTKYSAPTTGVTDFSNRIVRWATTNCANLSTSKVVIVFHKLLSNISLNHLWHRVLQKNWPILCPRQCIVLQQTLYSLSKSAPMDIFWWPWWNVNM